MSISKTKLIIFGAIIVLILAIFFIVPPLIGAAVKKKAETKLKEATAVPIKLSRLSIHLFPPGATFSDLVIGDTDPNAGNHPLINIESATVRFAFGTFFGGDSDMKSVSISGLNLNLSVDEHGTSSLTKFLEGMPPGKTALSIGSLTLRKIHIAAYINHGLKIGKTGSGKPNGSMDIAHISVNNLRPFDRIKGTIVDEIIRAEIHEAVCFPENFINLNSSEESVQENFQIGHLAVEFSLPAPGGGPVKINRLNIEDLLYANVYLEKGRVPSIRQALYALKSGMGINDLKENSSEKGETGQKSNGIIIEKFSMRNGRIETRGPDSRGQPAFWRLDGLLVNGDHLGIGPNAPASVSGQLKINSHTVSSAGPGSFRIELKNMTGGFPKSSFDAQLLIEGLAAGAFSVASKNANGPGIQSGQIGLAFSGPCRQGKLGLKGSLTLSRDFEVDSSWGNVIARIERGSPIENIGVRGTLDHPEFEWPNALAGALGAVIEKISLTDPIAVIETSAEIMGAAANKGIGETGKAGDGIKNTLKKLSGLFGK